MAQREEGASGLLDAATALAGRLAEIANRHLETRPLLEEVAAGVREWSGCESVSVSLFPADDGLVEEASLGHECRGHGPWLAAADSVECVCSAVTSGRTGAESAFFTGAGSFRVNSVSALVGEGDGEPMVGDLWLCVEAGCESLAIVRVASGEEVLGTIFVADSREGMAPAELVEGLERIAGSLPAAIARTRGTEALLSGRHGTGPGGAERRFGIYRSTPDGHLLACNSDMASILEFDSREELLAAPAASLYFRPGDRDVFVSVLEQAGVVENHHVELRTTAGSPVSVLISSELVADADGGPPVIEGTIVEAEQPQVMAQRAREAWTLETAGRLAGGVAHGFNNLFQAMLSKVQALRLGAGEDAEVEALAADIEEHVHQGARLARQLLLFSRQETVKPETLDLNRVASRMADELRQVLPPRVELALDLAPGSLPLQADRSQLDQLLVNLLMNAADAVSGGGRITLSTGSDGESVRMEIADSGKGIPEHLRDRLFEPFFTTKGREGTGLGLAVVRAVVTQYGGEIQIESREGEGSLFRVILPISGEDAPEPTAPTQVLEGRGERVLLVEDELGARVGIQAVLDRLGYQVVSVGSGAEAEALPAEPAFDVLLADIVLPDVSGAALARRLAERWPGVAVVLMSGYIEDDLVKQQVIDRSVRFLQKPFGADALSREVRSALGGEPDA